MPELTPKLGIKKPLGNETVSRASFNENWDIIDQNTQKNIIQSATAPSTPVIDDLWIDISTSPYGFKKWDGSAWQKIGAVVPEDIGAVAQTDFDSHLAETVIKTDITINVPSDYTTVQEALDSLKYAWIPRDVTVTIQVAAGTYTHTSSIVINHPCGSQIQIVGATPITTTITGVGTISGSAGAWSVPIKVASAVGAQVGQYAIIRNTTGTGDHYAFQGIWEITAVDTGTNTVTVKNTYRGDVFPTATLSGGDFIVLTTILKFTDCIGLRVFDKALGYLNQVAIVGNNSASTTAGIEVGHSNWFNVRGGTVYCGDYVGVSGFTYGFVTGNGGSVIGKYLSACNNHSGFYALQCGSIYGNNSISNGNSSVGITASFSSIVHAYTSIVCGNGGYGVLVEYSSSVHVSSSKIIGNLSHGVYLNHTSSGTFYTAIVSRNGVHGVYAVDGSAAYVANCTAENNVSVGFYALFSGVIYAAQSTASGNGTDYKAEKMGYIYCGGYVGTPTFSPALNTEGNYNAIITT
ncbi:right-handed parallel beta-helix repeat-containing protein [Thermosyntropha sp.]|uniref:right-handed parallel beta-helix repeat-containing protein n=1 Tax=Thermosyntropha sp. TaxID=2740820 RepID=UPI0025E22C7B|nr:right-handed parallel beta-helix repeat-containing protein [Thermosyntropha sp.]MBO8158818.1 right-handed parallel beta-helix repeat-containing protein [Thermosyntropha sp.]